MTSPITTHILDTSLGKPAADVKVKLSRVKGERLDLLGSAVTNADGRITSGLISDAHWEPGLYQLEFATGDYFAKIGSPSLYPVVTITFEVSPHQDHYHIPLLLSPFGYSTYRGS